MKGGNLKTTAQQNSFTDLQSPRHFNDKNDGRGYNYVLKYGFEKCIIIQLCHILWP